MTLQQLCPWLLRQMEFLVILALYATGELNSATLPLILSFGVLVHLLDDAYPKHLLRLPERALFFLVAILIAGSAGHLFLAKTHPLIIAAHALIILMGITWLMPLNRRQMGWRLALTFIGIVTAAALTPEIYMAFIIFFYLISSSLLLTGLYLSDEWQIHAPQEAQQRLPLTFAFQSLGLAMITLIISLVIFPILPRPTQNQLLNLGSSGLGYSEMTRLSGNLSFTSTQNRRTVLRIQLPSQSEIELQTLFPAYLLRGRVLENFDGEKWYPAAQREIVQNIDSGSPGIEINFYRERLEVDTLLLPYGGVVTGAKIDFPIYTESSVNNEWFAPEARRQAVAYTVLLRNAINMSTQGDPEQRERALRLPEFSIDFGNKLAQLRSTIFKNRSNLRNALSLEKYFKKGDYHYAFGSPIANGKLEDHLNSLLFADRVGHCEMYASAAAFLLRSQGIPTRLVTGFRINSRPITDVLIIREEDAHVWIEVWDSTVGWFPIDPTPGVSSLNDRFGQISRRLSDFLESYWSTIVVGFDAEQRKPFFEKTFQIKDGLNQVKTWSSKLNSPLAVLIICGVLGALTLAIFLHRNRLAFRRIQYGANLSLQTKFHNRQLRKLRREIERHRAPAHVMLQIRQKYEFLRFSHVTPQSAEWTDTVEQIRDTLRRNHEPHV